MSAPLCVVQTLGEFALAGAVYLLTGPPRQKVAGSVSLLIAMLMTFGVGVWL